MELSTKLHTRYSINKLYMNFISKVQTSHLHTDLSL